MSRPPGGGDAGSSPPILGPSDAPGDRGLSRWRRGASERYRQGRGRAAPRECGTGRLTETSPDLSRSAGVSAIWFQRHAADGTGIDKVERAVAIERPLAIEFNGIGYA